MHEYFCILGRGHGLCTDAILERGVTEIALLTMHTSIVLIPHAQNDYQQNAWYFKLMRSHSEERWTRHQQLLARAVNLRNFFILNQTFGPPSSVMSALTGTSFPRFQAKVFPTALYLKISTWRLHGCTLELCACKALSLSYCPSGIAWWLRWTLREAQKRHDILILSALKIMFKYVIIFFFTRNG